MSGRAGRRGMDDRGIVILMVDEKMSPTIGKQLLKVGETLFGYYSPSKIMLTWVMLYGKFFTLDKEIMQVDDSS